jgi:hypothetical protein
MLSMRTHILSRQVKDDALFTWTNPTATATFTDFTSVSKVITLATTDGSTEGEEVATMTLNFVLGNVVYN